MMTAFKDEIITYIQENRVSTTEIADCLDKAGLLPDANALNRGFFRVGEIFYTFAAGESNWNVHEDLQYLGKNEIVFIDNISTNGRAIIGDIVSKFILLYRQSPAIICNGKLRDAHKLYKENYPVWCQGVSPIGCFNKKVDLTPYRKMIDDRKMYFSGSIAVCDDSGVVIIDKTHFNESFLEKLVAIEKQEDIWYDCIDRLKWNTYDTVCLKKYQS
jgi:regulator of RNase E activity RraA